MVSDTEIEAAREAWREYWCEEDVPRNTKDGMTAALEAAARVRAEGDNECGEAVIPAPQPSGPVADLLDEGLEILNGLIDNIKRRGNYSPEATCTFIDQAGQCLREALTALTAGKPEQVPSGWQPIETAPADGRVILVYEARSAYPIHLRSADGDWWRKQGVGPSHWMPLPAAPTAGGGDE